MPFFDHQLQRDPAFAALTTRTQVETLARLQGATGTHGMLLDAVGGFVLQTPGLGRWVTLQPEVHGGFAGPLRAKADALPFCDSSFGAVVLRHLAGADFRPDALAREAARVLAPHGVLVVIECHPCSAWRWSTRGARNGDALRASLPRRWKKALLQAGLSVGELTRCGAAWPVAHATPRWLERIAGGAWVLQARKRHDATLAQRMSARRAHAVPEQTSWMPGTHRSRP